MFFVLLIGEEYGKLRLIISKEYLYTLQDSVLLDHVRREAGTLEGN